MNPLLSVNQLHVDFGSGRHRNPAVRGVSFDVLRGETLALVGESGSGKTTVGRSILRIHPCTAGEIVFDGERISGPISREAERRLRQRVQMVFQDPMASLNERAKVDSIVAEGLDNFRLYADRTERRLKVEKALAEVGLLPEFGSRFPHEFSGGQRQRIGIARALVMNPDLLIADEPISALDVSIRAQILNLLNKLKRQRSLTLLFIAHDLSVVRYLADRTAVLYRGRLVELGPTEELFTSPAHPYTRSLLDSMPVPDPRVARSKLTFPYEPSLDPTLWTEVSPGHYADL